VCIGRPLCHLHRRVLGLRIGKSRIAELPLGHNIKGLFSTRPFAFREQIGLYTGQLITKRESKKRYGGHKEDIAPYSIGGKGGQIIDSACDRSIMALANAGKTLTQCNASFGILNVNGTPVYARKGIGYDEEILIFYGDPYWKAHDAGHTTHETK
jgi:hypothetical protein